MNEGVISGRSAENALLSVHPNLLPLLVCKVSIGCTALLVPTLPLLWGEAGMGNKEINWLEAWFCLALAMCLFPAGVLADLWGRKRMLLFAGICFMLGAFGYNVADSFGGFIFAELFFAAGFAASGASETALFYDSLRDAGCVELHKRLRGRMTMSFLFTSAVACLIGGALGNIDPRLPARVLLPITTAYALSAALLRETQHSGRPVLRDAFKLLAAKPRLLWLMALLAVSSASVQSSLWLYQPYYTAIGIGSSWWGALFALSNLTAGGVALVAFRVERRIGVSCSLAVIVALAVGGHLLPGLTFAGWGWIWVLLHQIDRGFSDVVFSDYLQREFSSKDRATLSGASQLAVNLCKAALLAPLGVVVDTAGVHLAFLCSAVVATVLLLGILLLRPRTKG